MRAKCGVRVGGWSCRGGRFFLCLRFAALFCPSFLSKKSSVLCFPGRRSSPGEASRGVCRLVIWLARCRWLRGQVEARHREEEASGSGWLRECWRVGKLTRRPNCPPGGGSGCFRLTIDEVDDFLPKEGAGSQRKGEQGAKRPFSGLLVADGRRNDGDG